MEKKSLIILYILIAISISAGFAQTKRAPVNVEGINFIENSWHEALKRAKLEHKSIFVDAYASWCGPCKQLKNTTFRNAKAADFFNRNFINLAIDTEKGEGIDLARKWRLESYPTLYIFDQGGKLISRYEGFLNAADLIRFGQDTL